MYKKLQELKLEHEDTHYENIQLAESRIMKRTALKALRNRKDPGSSEIILSNMENQIEGIFK